MFLSVACYQFDSDEKSEETSLCRMQKGGELHLKLTARVENGSSSDVEAEQGDTRERNV